MISDENFEIVDAEFNYEFVDLCSQLSSALNNGTAVRVYSQQKAQEGIDIRKIAS